MRLHDSMGAAVFVIGEDDPQRPSFVFAAATHSPDEALEMVQRMLRMRDPRVRPIQHWSRALEDTGQRPECLFLGLCPAIATTMKEMQECYIRVLSRSGWRLLNDDASRYCCPDESDEHLKPDEGYLHICAAWDVERKICRKVGYTGLSAKGWLKAQIDFAAQNRYRGRKMTTTGEWLAGYDHKKVSTPGYPRVSVLDTLPAKPISDVTSTVKAWIARLDVEGA